MMDVKAIYKVCDKAVSDLGAEIGKYKISTYVTKKSEFNLDGADFSLFRTTFDNRLTVTAFDGNKKGIASGNDFSDDGIKTVVDSAVAAAASSEDDPANDIAPSEGERCFKAGVEKLDMDGFFERVREFRNDVAAKYPLIKLMTVVASVEESVGVFKTSAGSCFEDHDAYYEFVAEFAGNDGERTTGMNYFSMQLKELDTPFAELPAAKRALKEAVDQLDQVELSGKFEGTVIFTPACGREMLGSLLNNYVTDPVMQSGVSLWKDKLGEKVAHESLTLYSDARDSRIVSGSMYNSDGFITERTPVIEKGVLKNFVLSLYVANKLGLKPAKAGNGWIVEPGDSNLDDMIASVKKGLIVGGFSGGQPGANGEFSGVAKNSFLIEDGKITGAVSETMINGNLGDIFANIVAVSKEVICDGMSVMPYIAVNGITVSGK